MVIKYTLIWTLVQRDNLKGTHTQWLPKYKFCNRLKKSGKSFRVARPLSFIPVQSPNSMDKSRITYLVQKLRSKQAAPEERDELESFWHLAQQDKTLFNALSGTEKESIRLAVYEGIKSKIGEMERSRQPVHRTMPSSSWLLKIAASIAFILAITVFWTQYKTAVKEFQTSYGEHLTVALPDNSVVVINGNSTLRYNPSWTKDGDREVWIEGEGFFDVTHIINDQKFIVHTRDNMDVQVLGTKFNVKIRRGKTEVMLQEGKVRLDVGESELTETMMLRPGELATLEDSKLMKVKVRPAEYASWKEHKLFFNQTPLREVANILEDTYGIQVVFESEEIADRKLSGEISSDKATDILKAIKESFDINITHEGSQVVFH